MSNGEKRCQRLVSAVMGKNDFNARSKSKLLQLYVCLKKCYLLSAEVFPTDSKILIKL